MPVSSTHPAHSMIWAAERGMTQTCFNTVWEECAACPTYDSFGSNLKNYIFHNKTCDVFFKSGLLIVIFYSLEVFGLLIKASNEVHSSCDEFVSSSSSSIVVILPQFVLTFSRLFPQLFGFRGTSEACFVSSVCSVFISEEKRCLNSTI